MSRIAAFFLTLFLLSLSHFSCSILKEKAETDYESSWEFDNASAVKETPTKKESKKNRKKTTKTTRKKTSSKPAPTPKTPPKEESETISSSAKYSRKWDINLPENLNPKLLSAIDGWMGTPYKYGGRTKSGVDCSAFCLNIYNEVYKIDIERSTTEILKQSILVKKNELKEGDFVFFKINSSRVTHVGIYLGNNYFAHASTSRGVMISSLSEAYWTKYWHIGGRIIRNP